MNTDFYRTLAKKRMAAGALILNEQELVLIVKPTYKDHWEIPGGSIELDESPRSAVVREIKEELGLDFKKRQLELICLDYMAKSDSKTEALMFIFSAGILSKDEIDLIKLPQDELSEFKFVLAKESKHFLGDMLGDRVVRSFEAYKMKSICYFEGVYKS